jgi:hypothetical protein
MQSGAVSFSIPHGWTSFGKSVTFPTAFSAKPLILITPAEVGEYFFSYSISVLSASAFEITARRLGSSGSLALKFFWLAIGPE